MLQAIEPDFDLASAMQRASLRMARARLSPDHWAPVLQALAWELSKIGGDAPRLVRAVIRRLEQEPVDAPHADPSRAIVTGARWIAGAILAAAVVLAVAMVVG